MIQLLVFLTIASTAYSGYAGSSADDNKVDDGGNGAFGYGYSGSFGGPGVGVPGGQFPQFPQFDFNNLLSAYFDSLRKYHQQFVPNGVSYSVTTNDLKTNAKAKSSLTFRSKGGHGQENGFAGYGSPGGFQAFAGFPGGGFQNGQGAGGFGDNGAAAFASLGPEGSHQTAAVYPENPNVPNINTRFGAAPHDGGGFYSVSTSSQSGSSNLDGKPTNFNRATTTINDNGKVTSYTVHKP